MILICRTLLLLFVELIIEYSFGTMLSKFIIKKAVNPCLNLLMGFVAYQALFQVMTLAVVVTTRVLHHLSMVWAGCLIILIPLSFWYGHHVMLQQLKETVSILRKKKWVIALFFLVMIAFCYYVSINGEQNDDANYYIGLMTTTVDTDSLFQYNAYTGQEMESLYLRRVLATFEIHSAVLSQMTGIHPLLIARIFRACQNVILTSVAVVLCSKVLFWQKDAFAIEKSIYTTCVFWMLQMPFSHSIYTAAHFLLYRTYEAKAFTANVVVLLGLYLCVTLLREPKERYFIFIVIYLWGSAALSTSAMGIALVECVLLLMPVWIQRWVARRKQEKLHAG